jgi:hypothetical protein
MPSESPRESAFTTYTNEEVTGPPSYRSPLPEGFAPQFNPYRGTEMHGVDPGMVAKVEDTDSEGGKVDVSGYFEQGTEDIDPVPVRIVDTSAHEYTKWQTRQIQVGNLSPGMVASYQDGRTNLKVKSFVTGASRVWVGPDSNVTSYTGYPLDAGDEMAFSGEAPVYGIAETGTVTLAVFVEYSISE